MLCTALRLLLYGLVTGVGANKESVHTMHYDFHIVCHNYVAGRYSLPFMAATTASRTLGTKQIALYRGVAGFVVLI